MSIQKSSSESGLSTKDPYAEIRTLSTGGRLAVERMPNMASFTIGFFLPTGAVNETDKTSGLSHFMEHMLFKGSKKRSAKGIVKAIERVGGLINASTSREVTYFFIRISAIRLELALDVLSDLVFNPVMDSVSIEREKGVIIEEINMSEDDPGQALYDRFLISVHGNTPFGRPILGNPLSIMSFHKKNFLDYHKLHYRTSNLVCSIAGGIDPDKVQRLLEKHLSEFKPGKPEKVPAVKPPKFNRVINIYSKDVEQAALTIGFPSASIKSPDRYAFSLLDAVTAGGMMSRLFQEIREKRGLVYGIDSTHQPYSKGGMFTVEAGMREENLLKVLTLTLREMKRLADAGPGKRELSDTKLFLKGQWALGLESTSSRMIRNAMSAIFFDRLMSHDEVMDKLDAVTCDDVANAAKRAFEDGGPAIGAMSRFDSGKKIKEIGERIMEIREKQGENNG